MKGVLARNSTLSLIVAPFEKMSKSGMLRSNHVVHRDGGVDGAAR